MLATDAIIISIRTVDDLIGEKSKNGGLGVCMCVFFSFTCNGTNVGRKCEKLSFCFVLQ
jgi:hypothetical protein